MVPDLLTRWARRSATPMLLWDGGDEAVPYSWSQADDVTDRLAAVLVARGVRPRDRVIVISRNCPMLVWVWLACTKVNAVFVPLNVRLHAAQLAKQIELTEPSLILVEDEALATTALAGTSSAVPPLLFPVLETALRTTDPLERRPTAKPGDTATIVYTSGTTGEAKGVMLSHRLYQIMAETGASLLCPSGSPGRLYTAMPLFHIAAQQFGPMATLASGSTLVLGRQFDPEGFWQKLERYQVDAFHCVGHMANRLWLDSSEPPAGMPHRLAVGGGQRMVHEELEQRFNIELVDTYGMTETGGSCVVRPAGRRGEEPCGWPLGHIELRLHDGEIQIRPREPHAIFDGYFKRPDLTVRAFDGEWFETGDRGRLGADGSLRWLGRTGDFIRRRGENVSAREVESAIESHPLVREVAVVAVPVSGDQEVGAHVVATGPDVLPAGTLGPETPGPRAGEPALGAEEVVAWARERLPHFATPRYVRFCESLPRTPIGRVQKHLLAKLGEGDRVGTDRPVGRDPQKEESWT